MRSKARGVVARAASFTSMAPGEELARLATELDADLLLADASDELLAEGAPDEAARRRTCGNALRRGAARLLGTRRLGGPVLVPFGGAEHDWAAVELGAWFARAGDATLRLAGAAAVPERGRRDASHLLSHGALGGPTGRGASRLSRCWTPPGEEGMLEASRDAGLLVVGLSTRWHREGLGPARLRLAREAAPPTLLVRRGPAARGPGAPAPPSRASPGRFALEPRSAGAGRVVGPPREELLPLLTSQPPVREPAGTLCPRLRIDVPDCSTAIRVGQEQPASVR